MACPIGLKFSEDVGGVNAPGRIFFFPDQTTREEIPPTTTPSHTFCMEKIKCGGIGTRDIGILVFGANP